MKNNVRLAGLMVAAVLAIGGVASAAGQRLSTTARMQPSTDGIGWGAVLEDARDLLRRLSAAAEGVLRRDGKAIPDSAELAGLADEVVKTRTWIRGTRQLESGKYANLSEIEGAKELYLALNEKWNELSQAVAAAMNDGSAVPASKFAAKPESAAVAGLKDLAKKLSDKGGQESWLGLTYDGKANGSADSALSVPASPVTNGTPTVSAAQAASASGRRGLHLGAVPAPAVIAHKAEQPGWWERTKDYVEKNPGRSAAIGVAGLIGIVGLGMVAAGLLGVGAAGAAAAAEAGVIDAEFTVLGTAAAAETAGTAVPLLQTTAVAIPASTAVAMFEGAPAAAGMGKAAMAGLLALGMGAGIIAADSMISTPEQGPIVAGLPTPAPHARPKPAPKSVPAAPKFDEKACRGMNPDKTGWESDIVGVPSSIWTVLSLKATNDSSGGAEIGPDDWNLYLNQEDRCKLIGRHFDQAVKLEAAAKSR